MKKYLKLHALLSFKEMFNSISFSFVFLEQGYIVIHLDSHEGRCRKVYQPGISLMCSSNPLV